MAFQVTWALIAVFSIFIGDVFPVDALNRNPGIVTRINQAGLDFGLEFTVERLEEDIESETIPDISGTVNAILFDVNYLVSNIRIAEFEVETSSLKTVPGVGLELAIRGASFSLNDVSWSSEGGIYSDEGSFDTTIDGLDLDMTLMIRKNEDGHPTMAPEGCSGDVGSIAIDLNSDSWLFGLISGALDDVLTVTLNTQICDIISEQISAYSDDFLTVLNLNVEVDSYTEVDYTLISNPLFEESYMETAHKGEFHPIGQSEWEAPFPVPAIDTTGGLNKMVDIWISDYVINSRYYVLQELGILTYTITEDMLPSTLQYGLNARILGRVIPQLKRRYGKRPMEIVVTSTSPPTVEFSEDGAIITEYADLDAYVVLEDTTRVNVFTIALTGHEQASVGVSYRNITLEMTSMSVDAELKHSEIGHLNTLMIQHVVDSYIKSSVLPCLNEIGKQGFPLPHIDFVAYVNPVVSLGKDYILLESDLDWEVHTHPHE